MIKRKKRIDRGIKVRTEGIYAVSSLKEITYLMMPRLLFILGLLIIPLVVPGMYWQRVICQMCIYGLLALTYDFLAHFVGIVCLGGSLFIGIGGYIAGILSLTFGLSSMLTIPIATLVGALISTILLLPCLPLRGIYFAIATLMYPLVFVRLIEAVNIFGGSEGMAGVATFPNVWIEQYLALIIVLTALFTLQRLCNENIGMVLRAIKDNDQAVKASAINVTWHKAQALFIGSMIGCFAGAYLSHLYGWFGPSLFSLDFSILPIAASSLGGMGTLFGPVLGAFILTTLSEILRDFGTLRIIVYCIILIGFVVFRPEGMLNYLSRKYYQRERWKEL